MYGLVVVVSSMLAFTQGGDETNRDIVEAIATAYAANRESIPYGFARFRFRRGTGTDLDFVALHGPTGFAEATGLYAFDGENSRYDRLFAPKEMLADRVIQGDGSFIATLSSHRALTDGEQTLWNILSPYAGDPPGYVHMTQIIPGSEYFYQQIIFPLELNYPESWPRATDAGLGEVLEGGRGLRVANISDATIDDRPVLRLTTEAPTFRIEYWFDLERGAIPLKVVGTELPEGKQSSTRLDDIRPVANGQAWLPFRWTSVSGGVAKQLIIDEADFDRRPDPDVFRLDFEQPISIVSTVHKVKYDPQASWSLLRLPPRSRAKALDVAPTGPSVAAAPAMPGEREARPWWVLPTVIGLALAVALGLVAQFLRRRHA